MSRVRRGAVALTVALLGALVVAAPTWADDSKSVQVVSQDGRQVDFVVYLDPNIAANQESALSSNVIIASTEIPSEASFIIEAAGPRESILVLDASGSMRGARMRAARQAAKDYVTSLPGDVDVGLIVFNDNVEVGLAPTNDRDAVLAAIDDIRAGQRTALYDGILEGLDLTRSNHDSRLLVLSDGGDTASDSTIEEVMGQIALDDVAVDVVALTPNVTHAQILRDIAQQSGGQFLLATDAAGLEKAFDEASGSFGGKVAVKATVPPDVNASGKFAIVTVNVDGTNFTGTSPLPRTSELVNTVGETTTTVPTGTTPTAPAEPTPEASNTYPWLYGLLAALVVVILALTIVNFRRQQTAFLRTQQVLWYSSAGLADGERVARPEFGQYGPIKELDRWMATRTSYPKREAKLDNAELNMTPGAWLVIRIAAAMVIGLVLSLLFANLYIGIIVGALIGWLGTGWYVNRRENKSRKAFENELPDFLLLIASALRSGLSFTQALDSTAAEGKGQVARQIRRAMRETQMGSPIEQSLMRVSDRMQSDDLRWTVTALAIQREVGGNLSNILETAALTVQSRAELRREIRTLSAEGRLSGYVLAALPVGLFLYMLVANREYVAFFWTYTVGYGLLAAIVVIFVLGFIWMRQLVKIEV